MADPFPPEVNGTYNYYEILGSIKPEGTNNTIKFRTDQKTWKSVQKSAVKWTHKSCTLTLRIRASYMENFENFVRAHMFPNLVTINGQGITPFFGVAENLDVDAYIIDYNSQQRSKIEHYTVALTFLAILGT